MRRMAAVVAATAALAAAAAPASAATMWKGPDVDIAFSWYWDGSHWVQQFDATGGLAGRGTYAGAEVLDAGRGRRTTLRTAKGAVVVEWNQVQRDADPYDYTIEVAGRWRVVSATGAYAGMTGGGWFHQDVDLIEGGVGQLTWHGHVAR